MAPSAFPSPAERSASPSRCRRIDGGKRRRAGRRRPKRFETSRSESWRTAVAGVQGGRDALVASVRPPDFTTEHTERPTAVTEYTEALGMQGHGGGGLGVLCLLCAAKRLQCVQWRKKSRRFCNDLMIPIQLCAPLRVTVAILFRCHRIGLRTREHLPSSPTTSRARCAYRRGRSRSSHGRPRPFQRDRTPPQCPRPR